MNARTAKTCHRAVTTCEAIAAGGLALLIALVLLALVGVVAGWPWPALLIAGAYPAGHLAQIARHGPEIASTARRCDQAIRRQINDRTDKRRPATQEATQ